MVNNGYDCPVIITRLVINPAAAAALAAGPHSDSIEQMATMMAQWREYEAKEAKKKAGEEVARKAQDDLEENLRRQMAQKREESRRAAAEENEHKVAVIQHKQQVVRARRAQIAAKIVRIKAKVDAQDIAPTGPAVKYAVSPHALRLAAATLKGSRSVILIDGVPGPAFDELIWVPGRTFDRIDRMRRYQEGRRGGPDMKVENAPVIFNGDGARFAYVGRQGNEYVVMLDGRELARGPYAPAAVESLCFLPGGKRLAYITTVPQPKDRQVEYFRGTRLVVEGDENPPVLTLADVPISFSPDGEHYAYIAELPPEGRIRWEHAYHLVVDGKMDSPAFSAPSFRINRYMEGNVAPLFTGDSRHLVTIRNKQVPNPERKGEFVDGPSTIFVDQKAVLEAPFIERLVNVPIDYSRSKQVSRRFYASLLNLWVAPQGSDFIAVFAMPNDRPQQSNTSSGCRLYLNSRAVGDAFNVESITWSPDGKRYMAQCKTSRGSGFMIIDGKKEPEYQSVSSVFQGTVWTTVGFTADSSKSVYLARNDRAFLIVEGEESDGFQTIEQLVCSKRGAHIGFVVPDETGGKVAVIDGQALPPRQEVKDFIFSSDGTHYSFLSGEKIVLDGMEQANDFGGDFVHYTSSSGENDRHCLFSPDGKHAVYLAKWQPTDSRASTKAICLDGEVLPLRSEYSEVTPFFTPNSKHLIWIDWGAQPGLTVNGTPDFYNMGGYAIYVDGQLDAEFKCSMIPYNGQSNSSVARYFERTQDAAEMGADGTLTLTTQVGDAVKKLHVIPSSDTSMERLAALAAEEQVAGEAESKRSGQP